MTEKLYYTEPLNTDFTARVLSCVREDRGWAAELDRTAFFPEGGGQGADTGLLGGARVLDVRERDGRILHFCDGELPVGAEAAGCVDRENRMARMQIHSGEHIVSGLAHREWGCENVGFHMTENAAVIDFDRELSARQLEELEALANRVVWEDLPIRAFFPSAEELSALVWRQKKELSGQIRLVEIPGVDRCACCAPHMPSTGRIGLICLTDLMRHRGGVRFTLTAGRSAYNRTALLGAEAAALSRLFSVPADALVPAAERLLAEQEERKQAAAGLERRYVKLLAERIPVSAGNIVYFESGELTSAAMRLLAEALSGKCSGAAAVFVPDGEGRRYVIASQSADLRKAAREINTALRGRGGGSPAMIQGSACASPREIEDYFNGKKFG